MGFDAPSVLFGRPLGWLGLGIFLFGSLFGLHLGAFLRRQLRENQRRYRRAQAMVLASQPTPPEKPSGVMKPIAGFLRTPVVLATPETHIYGRIFLLFGVLFLFLFTWSQEYRSVAPRSGPLHPQTFVDFLLPLFLVFDIQIVALILGVLGFFWSLFGPIFRSVFFFLVVGWISLGSLFSGTAIDEVSYRVFVDLELRTGLEMRLDPSVIVDIQEGSGQFWRIYSEGYRLPLGLQLLGFRPLYLSTYRIERGALLNQDPQVLWVFLLRPDPRTPPISGYFLSPGPLGILSFLRDQGLVEPFALRSPFLEEDETGVFFSVLFGEGGR